MANNTAVAGQYQMNVLGGISPTRVSNTVVLDAEDKNIQQDVTFTFDPAIDVDTDLCANGGTVRLDLVTLNYTSGAIVFGSATDTYLGGFFSKGSILPKIADMYFIINGNAEVNHPPVLNEVGDKAISEGSLLSFTVSATDSDGDNLTYSVANLPPGATFDSQTQTFNWTPGYSDAGNYIDIEFTVIDSGSPMELDVQLITITVGNVNRAPVVDNPGPQEVLETDTLSFSVSAIDPDGDAVTYNASNTPVGSTFSPATGVFSWTPSLSDEGVYMVTFIANDDGSPQESAELTVIVTVGDNPTPTEQAEDLIQDIVVFAFPTNIENSYLANLHKVEQFILDGKINAALNQLNAFVNKLTQDYNQGVITQQEYTSLLSAANNLIADLQN
jgi:hypothetical protein